MSSQLSNIIYESLLEISETSEFLKNGNEQFIIKEVLYLEPLIEELPITLNKEEKSKEICYFGFRRGWISIYISLSTKDCILLLV